MECFISWFAYFDFFRYISPPCIDDVMLALSPARVSYLTLAMRQLIFFCNNFNNKYNELSLVILLQLLAWP